jgi:hypothetical protein
MNIDGGIGDGQYNRNTHRNKHLESYRDKYNIIKTDNIVDDGNIKFFSINRTDLDGIIRVAYIIKNSDITNVDKVFNDKESRRKLGFYELDVDALNKIQSDYNFVIANTSGLDNSRRSITFRGVIFENDAPTNKQAHLIINDLDKHFSSVRFAFSAYQLMQKNNEKYSMVLNDKNMSVDSKVIMLLDKYFEYALSDYLKNRY